MPRVRGESPWWEDSELDVTIDRIMSAAGGDPVKDALRDPGEALELLRRGGITDSEREQLRAQAEGALRHVAREEHLEALGAVVTSPPTARTAMRAKRAADRAAWAAVLEAIEQP